MWGGAMRQAGIVAAGALYALDHHVERLAEDHEHARLLAAGLAELPGVDLDPEAVETNIVVFEVPDAAAFLARLGDEGVAMTPLGPTTVRAVTHLDVDEARVRFAVEAAARALVPA
jgi:threonine aldolase